MNYLLDTNTIIDFTNRILSETVAGIIINSPIISFITRIELLVWPQLSLSGETVYRNFINASFVYGCDEDIILKTIEIRKMNKLKLPDAFIAATAIVHNHTLLTRNLKDFQNIRSLRVIDPHTL